MISPVGGPTRQLPPAWALWVLYGEVCRWFNYEGDAINLKSRVQTALDGYVARRKFLIRREGRTLKIQQLCFSIYHIGSGLVLSTMASIYSRYIPPAKPKNIDVPHISTVPESVKPSPLPAASPSPNSKPKSSANVEHKDSTPIATSKRKRDAVTLELQPGPVVKKAKKEKHEEKDKKNKSQKNPAPVVSLDKYAIEEKEPKHKAILEKRDKSMRKAEKHAKNAALVAKESGQDEGEPPAIEELHDLVPLPQPKPVPETLIQSATSSLPPWLASPIRVLPTDTANFADVGIQTDAAKILEQKGFKGAFAVQAAVGTPRQWYEK